VKKFDLFTAAGGLPESSATPKVTLHYEPLVKEPEITYTQVFYTDELEEKWTKEDEARRLEWYCTLAQESFKPKISNNKINLFVEGSDNGLYESAIAKIQIKILETIEKSFKALVKEERVAKERKLLESLAEICRYIPDLDRPDASFFIDKKTCGIGVTIKKSGTLSLLVHDEGKVEYSLASSAKFGGLFRMTGVAKTTKEVRNSEHIKALLGLIESK
jgi:hypothetical protein